MAFVETAKAGRSGMAEYVVEFGKDGRAEADGRLDAAAFHRNHAPIWAVLQPFLAGQTGDVLEAGSGTGQHVVHFARHSPDITWWPSDLNEAHLKSIAAWRAHADLPNIRPPLRIDLVRSRLGRGDGGGRWSGKTARAVLRQCDPHRAVARRGRIVRGRRPRLARRRPAVPLRSRSSATASTRRSPMPRSIRACAKTIRNGACATSPIWRGLPRRMALRLAETFEMPANNMILMFERYSLVSCS